MTDLTREYVALVFTEEAERVGADPGAVICSSHAPKDVAARRKAVQRIHKETRAAPYRIAKVWGADPATVANCLQERPSLAPYDQRTLDHLTWAYGAERAGEIVQGQDQATNADIASWRRLGGVA